jgi:predicted transcriptional regulator
MREEILRILRLVEQGRIKPDEAAELIDALTAAERAPTGETAGAQARSEEETHRLFERISRATEEAVRGINWRAIVDTIRTQTQRGLEEMRRALEELEREGWGIPRWHKHEVSTELRP